MNKNDITKVEESIPEKVEKVLATMGDTDTVSLSSLPQIPELNMILSAYPEDKREEISLSKKQVIDLLKHSKVSTFGVNNTLPMLCQGEECPHSQTCFFHKANIAPVGERCPDEIMFLNQMIPQLLIDMHVDIENFLEVSMVQEYAAALLDQRRAQNRIALEGDVKDVPTTVVQSTGTILYAEQETPFVVIKERAGKRLAQIRRELLATREQRAKYKLNDTKDPSTRAAELKEKFIKIAEAERREKEEEEENVDKAFKEEIGE